MATTTETKITDSLRYHFSLKNGNTRHIDIENPIDDINAIADNVQVLNVDFEGGTFDEVLVSNDYFDGDSDAVVTGINSVEKIRVEKTTTTTSVPF